jgi:hypothetical protein
MLDTNMSEKKRWNMIVLFAVAMAWVESALVVDLRTLVDRLDPYQPNPLPFLPKLGEVELIREIATLIMLFAVGRLAGQTWSKKWGYAALAFGVWDIFYYVFLKIIVDWPRSLWDWDILFLLPLPWWGPVIAPVIIAALMIIFGTLVTQFGNADSLIWPSRRAWILSLSGSVLAILVFMSDAIRAVGGGIETLRQVLPRKAGFNWPVFLIALALMLAPIIAAAKQIWNGKARKENLTLVSNQVTFSAQTFFLLLLYKILSRDP